MSITPTMASNLFTMSVASEKDPRQNIGKPYSQPPADVIKLRLRLLLEELLETVAAGGFTIIHHGVPVTSVVQVTLMANGNFHLFDFIDGLCDLEYVATGTFAVCGVPDAPHLAEVCRCNNAKFPGGVATVNEHGKFIKPDGWEGPEHAKVQALTLAFGDCLHKYEIVKGVERGQE